MRAGSRVLSRDLIADLYNAAVDIDGWPRFASLLAKAAAVESAGLWVLDRGQPTDLALTEDIRESQSPYLAYYHQFDPWIPSLTDSVMLGLESCPENELVRTEFYNDFARQYGILRPAGAKLILAPDVIALMAINQPHSPRLFEEKDKQRLQRLLPYFKRALQLRLRIVGQQSAAAMRKAALDLLDIGIVICDAGGRLRFVNSAAEALARNGAGIVLNGKGKPLAAQTPAESRALAALVQDAASGGPGGAIRLSGGDRFVSLLGLVTPLPRGANGSLAGPGHALVVLRRAWEDAAFTQSALAALFGLSEAQASIALAIFAGQSPEEIAAARGIQPTTLKTHLQSIYARTGAENQRDLIRLIAGVPPLRMNEK